MSIQLVSFLVGCGDALQTHVHRYNQFTPDTTALDRVMLEQMNGGASPSSLNELALKSGSLSFGNDGDILVEDGWATSRGLGLLRFIVSNNALNSEELVVVGYLTGGNVSPTNIDDNTLFVPTRCYSTYIQSRQDLTTGLPMVSRTIAGGQQFLMNNTNLSNSSSLTSVRPADVATGVGIISSFEDENEKYDGNTNSNINKMGLIVSKGNNLDPTFSAGEILKSTIGSIKEGSMGFATEVYNSLRNPSMNEINPIENAFFQQMNGALNVIGMEGFVGYSIEEIASVFTNLSEVTNTTLLTNGNLTDPMYLQTTSEYGASNYEEAIAQEVAMITAHVLMDSGLTTLEFAASNNTIETGVMNSEGGIAFHVGAATPILDNEENLAGRVETFKNKFAQSFFYRYNSQIQNGFTIGIDAKTAMFGVTEVTVVINGNTDRQRTYANGTFMLNRTSSNITSETNALNSTRTMFENVKDYIKG